MAASATALSSPIPASAAPGTGTVPATTQSPAEEPATPKDSPAETLGSHDADLLADAEAQKKPKVTVIIATDAGRAGDVAARVKGLGGTVSRRFDQVGYVLATVPTGKVLNTANLPGVAAVDLDETIKLPEIDLPASKNAARQAAPLPGPGATTPADNPYMPTGETGSVDFKKQNPSWDGRGVTIGVMDSGVDLAHPALQKTTTGERKIVDWVTATDPVVEQDATWRAMLTEVAGPTFTYNNATWTAPAGTWRVNRFTEAITASSEPGGDVNRDGDTTDVFGILYDPISHDIRVDVNQNRDFTDDAVMRPYREKFDVGYFGTDNPATAIAERMPFVVEYREDVSLEPLEDPTLPATTDYVNIGIPEGMHGSHVAGIAAGNDLFGNRNLDGQAPGAKIVSARSCSWGGGCTSASLTTGMMDLVINRHVDVVNVSIGGLPALNDGNNARARLYDELIDVYGVQIVISAGNSGPGTNTVGDPSVATDAISSAASISKETWLANYGSVTRRSLQLFNFSSRGPREDGGFKPNLTAPGSAISTVPTWEPMAGLDTVGYTLPPGYSMQNGTSMSAPQITGGVALLLSAAKQKDLGVTPAGLRRALYSTADLIPGESVNGQGNGQMDVPAAWKMLTKKSEIRKYTASAPVCTPLSEQLATANQGTGIYNRCAAGSGGLTAGKEKTVTVKLTRTTGPKQTVKHKLSWVGDRKAFSSAGSVDLPLKKTVSVKVKVRPGEGLNSAILKVDDPRTPVVDFEVLNTVVTGTVTKKPGYLDTVTGEVDRNSTKSFFVVVPEGATALQVNLSGIATGSQTRWVAINPWGVPVESTASTACYTNFSDVNACKPQERSYENPIPGIWELEVESRRTSPALNNPFTLTAKIQGVTVDPAATTLPSVKAGQAVPLTWTVKNNFGPVKLTAQGAPLGSAFRDRPTIADKQQQEFEVVVPTGVQRLNVAIGNTSDAAADLDLVLYNAAGQVVAQQADGDSEEAVSVVSPAAGTYTVLVDGYAVPSGSTQFDYLDAYFSPALGGITTQSTAVSLANGQSAKVTGSITAASVPPAGRTMFGEMSLVTDEGAVVGRGSVAITAVTE
ncbi:S8 family serine peptidase [Actinoplanes sp. DH11]|uniref:S8 family serine peptidase n=1 Tax=Actinoplanes sp. DH11 TaxID=2857011 RepID=UPI001E4D59D0|nr:S8 family serine peptidase [Actinoplanes sp. DH11]